MMKLQTREHKGPFLSDGVRLVPTGGDRNIAANAQCAAFTLVEMLVVIGLIGILAATLVSSYSHVKIAAWQSQASRQVKEVATAFNAYLQLYREWGPLENKTEMEPDVCKQFQKKQVLDVTTYKDSGAGALNNDSIDKFGLLDPWGRAVLKRNLYGATADSPVEGGGTVRDHRIQFRLDVNYDGYVDSADWPGIPGGARVRANVLVWSRGPDGQDDFLKGGRYPGGDDRLSWDHIKSRK
ncbi:MAG: type II secretion system protein [Kiritimatiellae bacterium]|nr:type II secretion system protein [Kiritimatiellia bacterium]